MKVVFTKKHGGDCGWTHFFNAIHGEVLGLVLCAMQISFILAKLSEVAYCS